MSRQVTLSILGLYNYDNTLFDNLVLPSSLNKSIVVDNILMELAELEVIYPDPEFMKFAIGRWSAKQKFAWEDYMKVLEVADYDPFVNMDRSRNYKEKTTRDLTYTQNTNAWNDTSADGVQRGKDTDKGTVDFEHTERTVGDSAMYTKQNIIEQEMDVRKKYQIYDIIVNEFKQRFCLQVY